MKKGYVPFGFELIRVVDGDTVVIDLHLGFDIKHCKQYVRFLGIDVVEKRSPRGMEATQFVIDWFDEHPDCGFMSMKYRRGKYGRILGDFFDGKASLVDALRVAGYEK